MNSPPTGLERTELPRKWPNHLRAPADGTRRAHVPTCPGSRKPGGAPARSRQNRAAALGLTSSILQTFAYSLWLPPKTGPLYANDGYITIGFLPIFR